MSHTPGPWHYQSSAGDHDYLVYDEDNGKDIAIVRNFDVANARLVAAAPELLEACETLANYVADLEGGNGRTFGIVTKARAAIAKAKG